MWMDDDGVAWTMTKGGHAVAVSFDEDGRYFFVDSAGDLFYDTGDEDVGFYVVSSTGIPLDSLAEGRSQPDSTVGYLESMGLQMNHG